MRVVHSGIDTFDVAFQGALRQEDIDALQAAKDEAVENRSTVVTEIGPRNVPGEVYGYGTKTGYSFIFDTGPDGETWTFNKNTNPQNWNIRVSIKARALAAFGYGGAKRQLLTRLEGLGCTIVKESISRADFAVDILAPGYEVDLGRVLTSPRSKVEPYWGDDDVRKTGTHAAAVFRGRRVTGFRVGAIKQRQIVMYDKRKAAIEKREVHWFRLWGLDPKDPSNTVWRIEARIGKRELKDRYAIVTFKDFEAGYGDAVLRALDDTRLVSPHSRDTNLSRRPNDDIWHLAAETAAQGLFALRAGLTRDQVRAMYLEQKLAVYRQQIIGNAAGYAAWLGLDEAQLETEYPDLIAGEIRAALNASNGKFLEAFGRATERARLCQEAHPTGCLDRSD